MCIVLSRNTKKILVAVPVMLLLLSAIAIPNFIKVRATVPVNACANNLRRIDNAKQGWAVCYHKTTNDLPTEADLLPFLASAEYPPPKLFPTCPSGGTCTIGRLGEPARCSIGGVGHTLTDGY